MGNRGLHIEAVTPHLLGGRRLSARHVEANSLAVDMSDDELAAIASKAKLTVTHNCTETGAEIFSGY